VVLNDRQDEIWWKWTENGQYSAQSAYQAQFFGSCSFDSRAMWKAKVEDKHGFLIWLQVQCKLLTADKLLQRNWPCNPVCSLCEQVPELTEHIALHCVYAQEVCLLVSQWTQGQVKPPSAGQSVQDWWNNSLQGLHKKDKQ
jgi:hypothetical protein